MATSIKHFSHLEKLRGWRQQAFVLSLAERALPNLMLGIDVLEIDTPLSGPRLVDAFWRSLVRQELLIFSQSLDYLSNLFEQFKVRGEYGARPAEDAVRLLMMTQNLCRRPGLRLAKEAGQLSFQTVTTYIEFTEGSDLDEHDLVMLLDKHPLVKAEVRFQRDIHRRLSNAALTDADLNQVRQLAKNGGLSGIGIGH